MHNKNLIKLAVIAGLALTLLIPLTLLGPIVADRMGRRDAAVSEIQSSWGTSQTILGPMLILPLRSEDPSAPSPGFVHVLPDDFTVDGELAPQERSRGIYEAVVYTTALRLSGSFHRPTPTEIGFPVDRVAWDQAYVALGVSDLRGVSDMVAVTWNGQAAPLLPGARVVPSGLHAPVVLPEGGGAIPFTVELALRGSGGVRFAPIGVRNEVSLRSAWPHPHFAGNFLPATREVGERGFRATWRMSHYARQFPQIGQNAPPEEAVLATLFGVDLLPGIDGYRGVERATKYGVLFICIVFLCFFLFEVTSKARIHPFQYGMVGLAVAVFFLLLLALSEVLPFLVAYSAASVATTACISLYSMAALGKRALAVTATLLGSFGLLYVVLRAEDYALLAGSVALFAGLAVTMRLTRKIDWYAEEDKPKAEAAPAEAS